MKQVEALSEEYGGVYGVEKFKDLFAQATSIPYGFLYLDLYGFTGSGNKPKAYSNFSKMLYEAPVTYTKNKKMLEPTIKKVDDAENAETDGDSLI